MSKKFWLSSGLLMGVLLLGLSFLGGVDHSYAQSAMLAPAWTPVPTLEAQLADGVAFVLDNTLYYAGGWAGNSASPSNQVYTLDLETPDAQWIAASFPASFPARFGAAVAVTEDRAYIVGGWNGTSALSRVDHVDSTGWYETGTLPTPLNFPAAAIAQNRIYVTGGLPGYEPRVWSAPVPPVNGFTWREETNGRLNPGLITRMVASEECLYIVGGRDSNFNLYRTIYKANFGADGVITNWQSLGNLLPDPLIWHAVAIDQNTLYVLGGETTNGNLNDQVFAYTIDSQTCVLTRNTALEMMLPGGGNQRLAAATRFGELYVLGGQTAAGYTNQVWKAELPIPDPVLTLYKSAEWEGDFDYGTLITYTLRYTNPWTYPGGQTDVIITDTIPLSTTFIAASEGAMYITSTNTLSWTLGALPKDAGGVVTFTVHVDEQHIPQWELTSARDARWSEDGTWLISSEIAYTVIYTPQTPVASDISVTGTLPPQLYPRNRTSMTSSMPGTEFAVNGQNVIWRVPGAITETGYLTVTTCVVQGFSTQMPLMYTISLQDTVSQTQRVYTQAIAPEVDGWVKPSCTTDTLQLGYPLTVSPLEDTRPIIRNQAWICSEEIAGCQPSNETITRYWPIKVFLPLVVRQY